MSSRILRNVLFWVVLAVQTAACTGAARRADDEALHLGYQRLIVKGEGYDHVAYFKSGHDSGRSEVHVYLEGDGRPWLRKQLAARDPTPHKPLMLQLMAIDPEASLYLGRPCYHGLVKAQGCTVDLWTRRRYSETVVVSMVAAIERQAANYENVVLLGYSGGGTLAMLIAERLPKTIAVVTVAANLDTERWAALHDENLSGSLNPAQRPALPSHIRQAHYAGGRDGNVPPALIRESIAHQHAARFQVLDDMAHTCCWQRVWPQILNTIEPN